MDIFRKFQKLMIVLLMIMMTIVLILAIFELGWILVKDVISEPLFVLEIDELLELFGLLLLVLIGIELLDSIKTYLKENIIHVEVVLIVAIIAVARNVIILDLEKFPSLTYVGVASIILALAIAYYLVKRTHRLKNPEVKDTDALSPETSKLF